MTNQIENDWDVMQSGYSEKQLYPQQLEVLDMHDVPCTTRVYEERAEIEQLKKQLTDLKSKNKALHALCRMRATIVTAEKWNSLRPHIKRAIKLLDRKEKALLASENNG